MDNLPSILKLSLKKFLKTLKFGITIGLWFFPTKKNLIVYQLGRKKYLLKITIECLLCASQFSAFFHMSPPYN